MVAEKQQQEQSARQWFREIVKTLIDGETSYKQPDVAREALIVAKKDRTKWRLLVEEWEYSAAYEEVRGIVAQGRSSSNLRVIGDHAFTPEAASADFERRFSKFWSRTEHVADRNILLPEMSREDLIVAATEREKRGTEELFNAQFLRRLANGLEGDKLVSQRFSEEEVTKLWDQTRKEFFN